MKNCSETRRSIDETGRFYMKLFISICTRENSSHPAQVFLFAGTSLSFLLDTIDTSGSMFFDVVFFYIFFNIETKLKQQISQNTNFFIAHIVTQMPEISWFHYFIGVSYDFIMQTFLTCWRKIVKSSDFKSSCGLRWWKRRYFWTKKFFWCF